MYVSDSKLQTIKWVRELGLKLRNKKLMYAYDEDWGVSGKNHYIFCLGNLLG